jgi:Tfp pilus assembly protein PilZ
MFRRLRIDFVSLEDFQQAYQAYCETQKLFVPTHQEFGLREVVDLQLNLRFCGRVVPMQAEVRGFASPTGDARRRGVAISLVEPIANLRLAVADTTGILLPDKDAPPPAAEAAPAAGQTRRSERSLARVTVTAESGSTCTEGSTIDLSATGALLLLEDVQPPAGTQLRVVLFHPTTDRTHEIPARVVRHAKVGEQIGIGVAFEPAASDEEATRMFLEEVRAIEIDPRRRTETITGSIDVLGLPTLVQMFAASVPEGTITLVRGQERGRIVFSNGTLRYARTGDVTGRKALSRLLGWRAGIFHFAPVADADEEGGEMPMMHRALFECIQKLDELSRIDTSGFPRQQRVVRTEEDATKLEPIEKEILDFLNEGTTVSEIIDKLPHFDVDLYTGMERLLEKNLIDIDIDV